MLLALEARKYQLLRQISEKEYRLMSLTKKLSELQQYSSNIGDGNVSMFDMLNVPASMLPRSMAFMMYSHNGALRGAQNNMQMMGPQINMQIQQMMQMSQNKDPNAAAMYQKWIFDNLYKQELQKYQKHEEHLLHQQEQEIEQEKARVETELKMARAELESTTQATKEAVNFWKPEYA